MEAQSKKEQAEVFVRLVATFLAGVTRLQDAMIVGLSASLSLRRLHLLETQGVRIPAGPLGEAVEELLKIQYSQYLAFDYVSEVSQLVYITTLFDTFLSDCTRFLLLLHPSAIGRSYVIPVAELLESSSRNEAISRAVGKKVKEISYQTFADRLAYLKDHFGLDFSPKKESLEHISHYSNVRNVIVHDQGVFDLSLGEHGGICCNQKTCINHPTPITSNDLRNALFATRDTVGAISRAIMQQVLKVMPEDLPRWAQSESGGGDLSME